MILKKDWAVLISQTGSEVISIMQETGFIPGLLVTNNIGKIPQNNLEILKQNGADIKVIPFKPKAEDYCCEELLSKKLITLHGYLRILPAEFLSKYTGRIYNGHPALITKYPELKGFNKQEDIAGNVEKYPTCGSVIHEVTPILDSGKIIVAAEVPNITTNVDQAYYLLRKTSLQTWKYFFEKSWKFD